MTSQRLLGRVVVVAGEDATLAAVAAAAADAGASVGVVSRTLPDDVPATVRFRADPAAAATWDRVGMHVEQHLGPVDGVATDTIAQATVESVFGPDLVRRGHGDVVVVTPAESVAALLSRMVDTRRAAPARPRDAEPRP